MDDIFEIKFPIESDVKEKVIIKFANKQGGEYNIFSYYWQCFVWAATIGFLRNERKPLGTGVERIFSLNTMRGNGGEKVAQALICMCIARCGTIDIMKTPSDAILTISEYANGGFYHIMRLMENGENTFNDFEKVKQEVFSRNYWDGVSTTSQSSTIGHSLVPEKEDELMVQDLEIDEEAMKQAEQDFLQDHESKTKDNTRQRWTTSQLAELKNFYGQGMTVKQLSKYFGRSEENIKVQLEKFARNGKPFQP